MKFYVPLTDNDEDAELLWSAARADLLDRGLPTTRRRIAALALDPHGEHLVEIGSSTPNPDELVMIILEASNMDVFYVCTPDRGVLEGWPYMLGLAAYRRVFDFDDEAVRWG